MARGDLPHGPSHQRELHNRDAEAFSNQGTRQGTYRGGRDADEGAQRVDRPEFDSVLAKQAPAAAIRLNLRS
jgi:hypothetical protein